MSQLKTQPTDASVEDFLNGIEDETKRADCKQIAKWMQSATRSKPVLWGENIIGFGRHVYHYASGNEAIWFQIGFSPRKQNTTLYLMCGFEPLQSLMQQLGKYKMGKACLYIKRLADVDTGILRSLITESVKAMRAG